MSLLAKAREVERGFPQFVFDIFTQYQESGPDYIHSLLTGYEEPPAGFQVPAGSHYNPYFHAAAVLAMPKPLSDDQVTYDDGSPQTVDQYSKDVSSFLMWASEPHLEERKRTGFMVMAETCCSQEILGRGYGIKEGSGQVLERFSRRSLAVGAWQHYSYSRGISPGTRCRNSAI